MKLFFAICLIVCSATISIAADLKTVVYEGSIISEDVSWRGSILVRGFVVVAPQATLRIEPGTIVRFAATSEQHLPGLVVQGRLNAAGTAEQPIMFTADSAAPSRGAWGGIVLLSTEKRNLLEHCRIEYAQNGIDVRFSSVNVKMVSIEHARTALQSHDSTVQMAASSISDAETGIEIHHSEFDARDISVSACQRGGVFHASAVAMSSSKFIRNVQSGLEIVDCRVKISNGEISENEVGARIKGSEGQLLTTGFQRNKLSALHLIGSRIKIQRCLFTENKQDGVRTEDGLALLLNNAFGSNGGYDIYNGGNEAVSARLNWWETTDQNKISQKIYDGNRDKNAGRVHVFPWLSEKPQLMP